MKRLRLSFLLLCCGGLLTGCGKDEEAKKDEAKGPEQAAAKDKDAADKGKPGQSSPNATASGNWGYLPKDTVLAGFVRPKQMIESEFVRDLKITDLQERMQEDLPFPAAEMDELALFVVKPEKMPELPQAGPAFPPEPIESTPFPPPELKPQDDATQPPENALPVPGTNPECDEPATEPLPAENQPLENPVVFRVKLTKAYSETDFLNRWSGEVNPDFQDRTTEPQTYNGKKYLLVSEFFVMQDYSKLDKDNPDAGDQNLPEKRELRSKQALYQGEPNTWYLGSEANVKLVIDGQGGSPLTKELQKIPAGVDAGFAATLEGQPELRDYIKKGVEGMGGLEQVPVPGVDRLPDDLLAVNAWFQHNAGKGDPLLQINLVGVNANAGTNIQQATQQGMQMLQGLVGFLQFGNQDPQSAPMIQKLATLVNSISVTQEGASVAVKLPHPGGLKQLALELQPAIAQAREQAKLTVYRNNLKEIGLGLYNQEVTGNGFFVSSETEGGAHLSWRVFVTPYLDARSVFEQFKLAEAWDGPTNKSLINLMQDVFKSPGVEEPGKTGWRVFAGNGDGPAPAMVKGKKSAIGEFKDGTSNTILVVQVGPDKATIWTDPAELPFDPKNPAANKEALGKLPGPTFMVLMADGSVRDLPTSISPELLTALLTRDGGEELTPEFLEKGGVDPAEFSFGQFPGVEPPFDTGVTPETTTKPAEAQPEPETTTPKPPEGLKPEE